MFFKSSYFKSSYIVLSSQGPTPKRVKQPQTMTDLSPVLTVRIRHSTSIICSGRRQTHLLRLCEVSSNRDSSLQVMKFHSSSLFSPILTPEAIFFANKWFSRTDAPMVSFHRAHRTVDIETSFKVVSCI